MASEIRSFIRNANPRFVTYLPIVGACIVAACSWRAYHVFREVPSYVSSGRIVVSGRVNLPEGNVYSEEVSNFLGTQMAILESEVLVARAAQQTRLEHPDLSGSASVGASLIRGTSIIVISATSSDREYAPVMLDAVLDQYIASRRDQRQESTSNAIRQLRDEIPRIERQLAAQEEEFFRFKEQHNMGFWEHQSAAAAQLLSQLKVREASLRMQLKLADAMREMEVVNGRENLMSSLGSLDATAKVAPGQGEGRLSEQLSPLKEQLIKFQVEREQLLSTYKPKHPKLARLDQQIQRQERLIELLSVENEKAYAQTLAGMRSELASVTEAISEWEKKALESTKAETEYERLQTEVGRTRELYSRVVRGLLSFDANKSVDVDIVQVLQRAGPARLVRTNLADALSRAGFFGGLVGLCLLYGAARLDRRAFSAGEIKSVVREAASIDIPRVPDIAARGYAPLAGPMSPALKEAMRKVAAAMGLSAGAGPRPRVILCASSAPGEGKSTVALHFALHAAGWGERVLLIDGDIRRGSLGDRLGLPADKPGLADLVDGRLSGWDEAVCPSGHPCLSVIPRGRPAPQTADRLGAALGAGFFEDLKGRFDLVVVDSAPLAVVADSARLLGVVDEVLLVARVKATHLPLVSKIADFIRGERPGGFRLLVNCAVDEAVTYGYKNGYGYV